MRRRESLIDSQSTNAIDLGSDHKAVKLVMKIRTRHRRPKGGRKRIDYEPEQFKAAVAEKLDDLLMDARLDAKCEQIQGVLLEAAEATRRSKSDIKEMCSQQRRVKELIDERRALSLNSGARRSEISK